jgi:hypothetical protein
MRSRNRCVPNIKIAGLIFRAIFIVTFAFAVLWSSWPRGGSLATLSRMPTLELVRGALGVVISLAAIVQIFIPPKDKEAFKTWTYIGIAGIGVLLAVAVMKSVG